MYFGPVDRFTGLAVHDTQLDLVVRILPGCVGQIAHFEAGKVRLVVVIVRCVLRHQNIITRN